MHDLTVVIPNYNHGALIGGAVASLAAQTRPPDRVLVIDDGSTDDSLSVIEALAATHPWLEVVVNPRNLGVIATLNRGIALCETAYVTFLAADDYFRPRLVEASMETLARHPEAAFSTVKVRWVDPEDRPLKAPRDVPATREALYLDPARTARLLWRYGTLFNGNGAVYRSDLLRLGGGYDPALGSFTDGYAMQRLAAMHGYCVIPEELAVWRRLPGSYAHRSAASVAASQAILAAVESRLSGVDKVVFSEPYKKRLISRLAFNVAKAASLESEADPAESLPQGFRRDFPAAAWLLDRGRARLPGPVLRVLLLAVLRPFDLDWVIWRRL